MEVNVRFRYNKRTGEVEIFEIDDLGSTLTHDEHNREHDRITAEVGSSILHNPRVEEVLPGSAPEPEIEAPDSVVRDSAGEGGLRPRTQS